MLVSELISALKNVEKEYGDISVNAEGYEGSNPFNDILISVRDCRDENPRIYCRIIGYKEDKKQSS